VGPQDAGPVEPGSGWPGDPATRGTPVAHDAAEVATLASTAGTLHELEARQSVCRACPRLVTWREQVAVEKRRSFQNERYWGRPIASWGAERPAILIVGLAPAAHGGNRTGRIFTGDRSGDFLFASLYRCGLAAQPESVRADDGQRLIGARMVAAVKCAPPANKPTPAERDTCAPWLTVELAELASSLRVVVCLGGFAWQAMWPVLAAAGFDIPRPRPAFAHAAEVLLHQPEIPPSQQASEVPPRQQEALPRQQASEVLPRRQTAEARPRQQEAPPRQRTGEVLPSQQTRSLPGAKIPADPNGSLLLIGCYHPSQQNTFTGRVTPEMLDAVFMRAVERAGS
jgi:uracil-DNA glycosylase